MTDKQPEALRLAEWIERRQMVMLEDKQAAAELRRLHEENEALRAALAQPEQAPTNNGRYLTGYKAQPEPEPVIGTKTWFQDGQMITQDLHPSDVYLDPPQREWQGLTDEEIYLSTNHINRNERGWAADFARAIEEALRRKNT